MLSAFNNFALTMPSNGMNFRSWQGRPDVNELSACVFTHHSANIILDVINEAADMCRHIAARRIDDLKRYIRTSIFGKDELYAFDLD